MNPKSDRAGPPGILPIRPLVLVNGAGDLASGVAVRLHRSGFAVAMTEIEHPLAVRRMASFAQAVFDGCAVVEGVTAVRCDLHVVDACLADNAIPVIVDPHAHAARLLRPAALVDAVMAKNNAGTRIHDAPFVVALGPGFCAGADCHAVIETNRGHHLGRVLWKGSAEPDTGQPGDLPGAAAHSSRVLRAPIAGTVISSFQIGDHIAAGEIIAVIHGQDGARAPLTAPFAGILRGLIHPSVPVATGTKIGDLDPRAQRSYCFTVSDKSLAVGGGVLEALLTAIHRSQLPPLIHVTQPTQVNRP